MSAEAADPKTGRDEAECGGREQSMLFREPEFFRRLEQQLLPALIAQRRAGGRRLRVWSAACGDGGEPYALAILLHGLLPDASEWQLSILGSDADRNCFPQPRQPRFPDAAVAHLQASERQHSLRRASARHWTVVAPLRRWVEFAHIDLQRDPVPSLLNNAHAFDLIVCRGLLPGLPQADQPQVLDALLHALAPGGSLLIESCAAPAAGDDIPGLLLGDYRCWQPTPAAQAIGLARPAPTLTADLSADYTRALLDFRQGRYARARLLLQTIVRRSAEPVRVLALLAKLEAVQGRFEDARAWCELATAADPFAPAVHCLRASVMQAQGAFGEAMQAFQRALYLDPAAILAHFGLGALAARLGRYREAERHFSNAHALLCQLPADEELADADGLTAGRLLEMIGALREDGPCGENG